MSLQALRECLKPSGLQVSSARASMTKRLSGNASPLDYSTALRIVRDALRPIRPHPVVVSEGANTMDQARCSLA